MLKVWDRNFSKCYFLQRVWTTCDSADHVSVQCANLRDGSHAPRHSDNGGARGSGSGLGLSIVQAIAHAHGGQAILESWPGRGTRVRIWLPARAAPSPLPQTPLPDRSGPQPAGVRITPQPRS